MKDKNSNNKHVVSKNTLNKELSLQDLLVGIAQQKLWILVGLILGVAIASAVNSFKKPIYKASALVQVRLPSLSGELNFENLMTSNEFMSLVPGAQQALFSPVQRISDRVLLELRGEKPTELDTEVRKIVEGLNNLKEVSRAQTLITHYLDVRIDQLDSTIGETQPFIEKLQSALTDLSPLSVTYNPIAALTGYYDVLNEKNRLLQLQGQHWGVHILGDVFVPLEPISPRKTFNLLAGIILGLCSGLSLALLSFLRKTAV